MFLKKNFESHHAGKYNEKSFLTDLIFLVFGRVLIRIVCERMPGNRLRIKDFIDLKISSCL